MDKSKETAAYAWFKSLNNVVLHIHHEVYKGDRKSCKYKIGKQIIATVENDKVTKIVDFSKGRVIVPDHQKGIVQYMPMLNETTLAENVQERIQAAIRANTPLHIFKAYEVTGLKYWVANRIEFIYKYGCRTANPQIN